MSMTKITVRYYCQHTVACVERLLKAGADVNIRSKHGRTVIPNAEKSGCSGKLKREPM